MFCPKCGAQNAEGAQFCASCGGATEGADAALAPASASSVAGATLESLDTPQGGHVTTVNVQVPGQVQKNGLGTAGFILALIGIFVSWVPVLGWVVWLLGAVLSLVGLSRVPKGFAIAGSIISFIDLIVLLVVVAGCSATLGMMSF